MTIIFYANTLDGKVAAHHYKKLYHDNEEVKFIPFHKIPSIEDFNLSEEDTIVILGANEKIKTSLNCIQISHKFDNKAKLSTSGLLYIRAGKTLPKYIKYITNKELKLGKFRESEALCIQLENILSRSKTPENTILDQLFEDPEGEIYQLVQSIGEVNYDQYMDIVRLNAERAYITNLDNGLKMGILNTRMYIADIADYLLKVKKCDAAMIWYMDRKDSIIFQLRSLGAVDVSEIARFYTGNGYRNAAGFTVPFRVGIIILDNMIGITKKKSDKITIDKVDVAELESILEILGIPSVEK